MVVIFKNKRRYITYITLTSILLSTTAVSGLDYKATIIVPKATIHQDKDTNSQELDKLNIGDQITIKEALEDWYRVELFGGKGQGWILSEDVVISDASYNTSNVKKGEVTVDVLNVRIGPSTEDSIITQIRRGSMVTIIASSNDWYEVILDSGVKGWVHSDYIKNTYNFPRASINSNGILLKEEAQMDSSLVSKLNKGDVVYVKNYLNNWYNVITADDLEGWVESSSITMLVDENTNVSRSSSSRNVFENIDRITEKYLGKKYVYGASGPNSFDCSGFTYYILTTYYNDYLKLNGINQLPRRASEQARIGTPVSRSELQKGDLVFFNTDRGIGKNITHVGIYLENDVFIHASSSKKRIMKSSLSESYYKSRFIKAIRL